MQKKKKNPIFCKNDSFWVKLVQFILKQIFFYKGKITPTVTPSQRKLEPSISIKGDIPYVKQLDTIRALGQRPFVILKKM